MINRCLLAVLLLFSAASARAQLRVELEFEQETYLPREPIYAVVTVYNSFGQTLELGADNEWLSFSIEPVDGSIVNQKQPAKVQGEFTLPSAHRARKLVNIEEAFDVAKFGRYNVVATVRLNQNGWTETFSSKPVHFGISTGVTLWEQRFGIPSATADKRPEIRRFQLVQANHLKELSLYVRILGDSEGNTISLFPIGKLVSFSRPEPQMDRWSNLHVLYQDSGYTFRYHVITPDGLILARQTWAISETRPSLRVNSEGRIAVSGGVRRVTAADLPPPELASEPPAPAELPSPAKAVDAETKAK